MKAVENKKEKTPNYLLPIIIIIGVPLILALLITAATLIFQPYAKGCKENGKSYSHMEQFTSSDGCNTCTCNDGNVSCTEMECTMPVQSISRAIELLKEIYPEFDSYPNSDTDEKTGPTTVIEEDKVDPKGGWYIAFILRGDDEKIVSGRCLSIDNYGDIGYLGDAIPETMEIDIKTCKEPISEFTQTTEDLTQPFLGDEPFPTVITNLSATGTSEFNCTPYYYIGDNNILQRWDQELNAHVTIEHSILLDYINLTEESQRNLRHVKLCEITDNRQLLVRVYPLTVSGDSVFSKTIITMFKGAENQISETEISEDKIGYFGPTNPILYLEDKNELYYTFDAADGLYASSFIYKICFTTDCHTELIYRCDAEPDESSDVITQQVITCH